jgi:NAD-dependent DNA ligase
MDFKVKAIYNAIINDKEPFKNALKSILEILVKKQKLLNEKEVLQEIDNLTKNFKPVLDIVKQTSISLPTDCPSCGSALVKSETGKQLSCVNEECPTRRTSKLTTYLIDLQSGGNKTNIDDRKMEALLVYIQRTLYKEGERQSIVRDIIKLYEIADDKEIVSKLIQYSDETKYDENPLAFKDKRAEKFVADILITKGSKESDFLGAIGIDNFKSSTARKLLRKISLQRLLDYDYSEPNKKLLMEEIMTIPDFAEKTAELVVSFFAENKEDIQELHQKVNPVKEEVKVVEGAKIIQMTGTGSISWEFFQALTPNDMAVTKGVLYKDIPVSDNGANKEIKEVLKRESMVFQYNDENIKLIGGNNPTGKTDIVMSDKLSAAVSKAKALKNTFTFDDIENQSQKKQFEQLLSNGFKSQEGTKICVLTDTKVMISFFTGGKTLKQEQTQVVDKQTTLNRTI